LPPSVLYHAQNYHRVVLVGFYKPLVPAFDVRGQVGQIGRSRCSFRKRFAIYRSAAGPGGEKEPVCDLLLTVSNDM
jgi:hypothetical protein